MKKSIKSSDYISDDGWDQEILEIGDIIDQCSAIGQLEYELRHCVRGAYTSCATYEELAQWVIDLSHGLMQAGEALEDASYELDDM